MKKFFCLLLVSILVTSCFAGAFAEGLDPSLYLLKPVKLLQEQLLVPSSLDLRKFNILSYSENDIDYVFSIIHYVAQNKMGGYTDNYAYALATYPYLNIENAETVVQVDSETFGDDNEQMKSLLSNLIIRYYSGNYEEMISEIPTENILNVLNTLEGKFW